MDADTTYTNGAFIQGAAAFPPRWATAAAGYRSWRAGQLQEGLSYGPAARHKLDLFLPEGTAKGLLVFIHGGYWLAFGRGDWSHLAEGALHRGWAVAFPSYTLCPEARISAITAEVGRAVDHAAGLVQGPIVVTGHSAGGHLSARMACADAPVSPETAARIARVIPISPLSDLRSLMNTTMNSDLKIDADEALRESPALLERRAGTEVKVWVGAEERPAFLDQARWLAKAWGAPWHVAPGVHHFDVIDALQDPRSALVEALFEGL